MALLWTSFWIRSGVERLEQRRLRLRTAAWPRSMSKDSARAVSSAWMTAFIARVSWLSRSSPLLKTAPRNAPSDWPSDSTLP